MGAIQVASEILRNLLYMHSPNIPSVGFYWLYWLNQVYVNGSVHLLKNCNGFCSINQELCLVVFTSIQLVVFNNPKYMIGCVPQTKFYDWLCPYNLESWLVVFI